MDDENGKSLENIFNLSDQEEKTVVDDEETLIDSSAYLGWFIMLSHKYDSHEKGLNPGISVEDWKKMIEERFQEIADRHDVTSVAYVFHEPEPASSDEEAGEKGYHAHAIIKFNDADKKHKLPSMAQTKEFVVDLTKASDRTKNVTNIDSYLATYRYMIHVNDKAIEEEKRMYKPEDVTFLGKLVYWKENGKKKNKKGQEVDAFKLVSVSGDRAYKVAIKASTWVKNTKKMNREQAAKLELELAEEVAEGKKRHIDAYTTLKEKAGYFYARNSDFEHDSENYVKVKYEEMIEEKTRDLRNIYVAGDGGVGKTFLANELAEQYAQGLGVYIASPSGKKKTPDPMNHLKDEKVAIMNEVGDDSFSVDEFNNSFDPHMMAPFSSRNENKKFIGDTIIMTQSVLNSRFSKDLMLFDKGGSKYADNNNKRELKQAKVVLDKYWQVRRRIKNNIILLRDPKTPELIWANVFNVDSELKTHVYVGAFVFKNPFKSNEAPTISEKDLDEALRLMDIDPVIELEEDKKKTIEKFVEENEIEEVFEDDLFTTWFSEYESVFAWDFIPTAFLYDLFNGWLKKYEPQEKLWGLSEFSGRLKRHIDVLDNWAYSDKPSSVRKALKVPEPLIDEFNLTNWLSYEGTTATKRSTVSEKIREKRYMGIYKK